MLCGSWMIVLGDDPDETDMICEHCLEVEFPWVM